MWFVFCSFFNTTSIQIPGYIRCRCLAHWINILTIVDSECRKINLQNRANLIKKMYPNPPRWWVSVYGILLVIRQIIRHNDDYTPALCDKRWFLNVPIFVYWTFWSKTHRHILLWLQRWSVLGTRNPNIWRAHAFHQSTSWSHKAGMLHWRFTVHL